VVNFHVHKSSPLGTILSQLNPVHTVTFKFFNVCFSIVLFTSSVDIATGWMAEVRFPAEASDISLLHSVKIVCGHNQAPNPMATGVSFPRDEAVGA
jgi:hypothetical protein